MVLAGKHVRSIIEVLRLNIHGNWELQKKMGNFTLDPELLRDLTSL
jgi:hypothetical protein